MVAPLNDDLSYLKSLYNYIAEKKEIKLDRLASDYCFTFSDKKINELINDIGLSLSENHSVSMQNGGVLGPKILYIPDAKAIDGVVQNIRAEFLEEGTLSDEIMGLTSLLDKSGILKKYFSSYENKQLKMRLEEIKKSPSNKIVSEFIDYINLMYAAIFIATTPK